MYRNSGSGSPSLVLEVFIVSEEAGIYYFVEKLSILSKIGKFSLLSEILCESQNIYILVLKATLVRANLTRVTSPPNSTP